MPVGAFQSYVRRQPRNGQKELTYRRSPIEFFFNKTSNAIIPMLSRIRLRGSGTDVESPPRGGDARMLINLAAWARNAWCDLS